MGVNTKMKQNFLRTFFLVFAFCLGALGNIIVVPVAGVESVDAWDVRLEFESAPVLNEPVKLSLYARPLRDVPSYSMHFVLLHGFEVISGELEKNGSAYAHQQLRLDVVVRATEKGQHSISGWADSTIDTNPSRGFHVIEVAVSEEDAIIFERSPEPIREGKALTEWTITPPGNSINVKGKFVFHPESDNSKSEAIRGAEVELWDSEFPFPDTLLAFGHTDNEGNYEFNNINNDDGWFQGGMDIYVVIQAKNSVVDVISNPWWFFGSTYAFKTSTKNDVEDSTISMGTVSAPNDQHGAWEILNNLQIAHKFLLSQIGKVTPQVTAFWDDDFTPVNSYYLGGVFPELDFIDLPIGGTWAGLGGLHYDKSNFAPIKSHVRMHEVIFHEYGHYVMDYYADVGPPFTVMEHEYDVAYNTQHAFVEGWAEFFSAAVRHWMGAPESEYMRPNVERNLQGDDVEGAIAGVFWDLYDNYRTVESTERLSLGFAPVFNTLVNTDPNQGSPLDWPLTGHHPWDIYEFWDGFRYSNAGESVGYFWQILNSHGIEIPDETPPGNPTNFSSPHKINVGSEQNTIWIFWEGGLDDLSGVSRYAVAWLPFPNGDPTMEVPYGQDHLYDQYNMQGFAKSPPLPPGSWYFLLKTVDRAGNWAEDVYTVGPFEIQEKLTPTTSVSLSENQYIDFNGTIFIDGTTMISLEVLETPYKGDALSSKFKIGLEGSEDDFRDYSTPFTFGSYNDGPLVLEFFSQSKGLNHEAKNTMELLLDNTPPTTTHSIEGPVIDDGKSLYVSQNMELKLVANDELSGVAMTSYRILGDSYGSLWIPYTEQFSLTSQSNLKDGSYTLQYTSTDNIGNEESITSVSLILDSTPPSTSLSIHGPQHYKEDGYAVTKNTEFVLKGSEDSLGLALTKFRITDDGKYDSGELTYSKPFSIGSITNAESLNYTVMYWSVDQLGNPEPETSIPLTLIDAPSTTLKVGDQYPTDKESIYVSRDTGFEFEMRDSSGNSRTLYRIFNSFMDSGVQNYSRIFNLWSHEVLKDGTFTIEYMSVNNEGIEESVKSVEVILDSARNNAERVFDNNGELEVDVSVRGAFLHAMDDWPYSGHGRYQFDEELEIDVIVDADYRVEEPTIVDLEAYGFTEGDKINLRYDAEIYYCGVWNPLNPVKTDCGVARPPELWWGINGLFSATSELKPIDVLHRVPGAIEAGDDIETPLTLWSDSKQRVSDVLHEKGVKWYEGQEPTDIPEDFMLAPHTGMTLKIPDNAQYLFLSITDVYYRDNLGTVTVYIEHVSGNEPVVEQPLERGGIPGFPLESIVLGTVIAMLLFRVRT